MTNPDKSTRNSSRKNRVYAMRQFLLETFHHLPPHATILDVAGGNGTLSWLLLNVDRYNSVVIDPRPNTNHKSIERSLKFLKENPEMRRMRAVPDRATHQPLAALVERMGDEMKYPVHLRLALDDGLIDAIDDVDKWDTYWRETHAGYNDDSSPSGITSTDALSLITNASLVVGFHPDQATEACIDLAKKLKVPFAVCPCCVFPREFPQRRLIDGTRVTKYHHLVRYLREKCGGGGEGRLYVEELAFFDNETARNIVLYTMPEEEGG